MRRPRPILADVAAAVALVLAAAALGVTALSIESDPHAEGFYLRLGARRIGEVPSTLPGRVLPLLEFRINT